MKDADKKNPSKKRKSEISREISPEISEELSDAASAWKPDSVESSESHDAAGPVPLNPEGGNDYVSLIGDPFGIKTLEISEAQRSTEELDLNDHELEEITEIEAEVAGPSPETPEEDAELDAAAETELGAETPFEADNGQLESLAKALEVETQRLEAEAAEAAGQTQEASAEELARQIAEDQELAAQMAREAAEAEKVLETDPELLAALPREPQPDAEGNLDLSELQSCLETLLFMMDKPVSPKKLQEWLGPDFKSELFTQALEALQARYQAPCHGIELVEISGGWQLRTKPGRAALAKKLAKIQTQRLSSGGMESLAIIAYRQPVMKEEIDKIRGVDSSYFIRGLLDKKLIAITGRSELPGRPMLYSTTDHFLELFGLKDLNALPSLRELEQMVPASESKNPEDADPRLKEMRRLVDKMKTDTSTTLLYDPKEDDKILREIRERVHSIPTSTPYLDEQKALEKAAKLAAQNPEAAAEALPAGTQLEASLDAAPAVAEESSATDALPTDSPIGDSQHEAPASEVAPE